MGAFSRIHFAFPPTTLDKRPSWLGEKIPATRGSAESDQRMRERGHLTEALMGDRSSTRRKREFREELKAQWMAQGRACNECGLPIDWTAEKNTPDAFELDHVMPVKHYPHLEFDANNCAPCHSACNRSKGARAGVQAGTTSEAW